MAICEATGHPCWSNGPFPGPTADITICRSHLLEVMDEIGCYGIADGGYQGESDYLIVPPCPYHNLSPAEQGYYHALSKRRVIIENFFGRLKLFTCLSVAWRHSLEKHKLVFHMLVSIISIDLEIKPLRAE